MKSLFAVLLPAVWLASSAQGQLFSDNFTRGTDPGPLTPWGTNSGGGNWTVTGGVMRGGINPNFSYGFAFITNNFTNFAVQARIQFPAGGYGGGIGGRLERVGGAHYAAWVYPENTTGDSNVLRIIKFSNYTAFTDLAHTNLTAVGTGFHTVKLEFTSANQINAYFDTNTVVSVTDATPLTSGSVSLDFWTADTGYLFNADDVTVTAIPLVVSNDSYTVVSGLSLKTSAPGVLANDTGGGPLTALLGTGPTHGTLNLTNNGGFTYTPTGSYIGADSFTYRATDGVSTSSVATVSITVTADHAPVANSDTYTMVQDTALTVTAPGVLGNDTDADGNNLTAAVVSSASHGSLSLNSDGGFTYTPTAGFSGTDSFTYRANDGMSNSSPATVTISVLSIVPLYTDSFTRTTLSPWIAQSGTWAVTNNTLRGGTNALTSYGAAYLTTVWSNYSVQATVQLPVGAFGGGVDACVNPATGARYSAWVYPENSPGGSNTLKLIKFQDWSDFAYNGTVSVPIDSQNLASVGTIPHTVKLACAGNRISVFFDGVLKIIATDSDSAGSPYTNGSIAADFWTASTPYQLTVDDILVASLINGDSYSTTTDSALTVAAPGVLANDTEIAGTTLTAVRVAGPAHGILSLASDGSFTYTATNGYTGSDSFTYQAVDGAANLGTATVSINVLPTGFTENFDGVTAPALPSGWTTSKTGVESLWVTRNSTTNDTAPNAAYVPDPNSVGTSELVSPSIMLPAGQSRLSFRSNYRLEADATANYDGGVLEIKIGSGSFTDILAAGGSFVTNGYDGPISTAFGSALAGRQAWTGNSGGFITTLVNLPATAMNQSVQLRWLCATDSGNGNTVTNGWYIDTVSITNCACACCWNTPPLLASQTNQTVDELTPLAINNAAVDADLPTQTLAYSLLSPPAGATIGANSGLISWTPSQTQSTNTYTLTTKVTDNGSPAQSATNSFDVTIREVNVPPTLPNISTQIVSELTAMTVINTATNANIHSTNLGYGLVSPVPAGLVISSNGIITWTPAQNQSPGTNPVTTIVTNSNPYDTVTPRLTATNTFWVVVREVNIPPTLPTIPAQIVNLGTTLSVTNTATNANIHSAITGYRLVTPPTPSGVSISPAGVISWTPTALQSPSTNMVTTVVTNSNPYDTVNPRLMATNSFTVYVYSGPYVTLNSTALIGEGFLPTNNAIDPGETVSINFGLKNLGGANTTNLVATLLATNGVTAPSAPQSYGALLAGGAEVSKAFSFTASGNCGDTIIPTLQLQDGSANYGTVSLSYTMGHVGTVLTQNFDSVTIPALPSDWTTSGGGGTRWFTTNTSPDTTPNVAFVPDAAVVSSNDLVSPQIQLPLGQSTLSFRHTYSLESDTAFATNGFDGGVLEIKIGNGSFADITNSGGVFVANGYNRKIDTRYSNPIAGRWAWSGTNGAYVTTTVTLPPSAAGQPIQLRWRCATDDSTAGGGWRVDSIGITGNVCAVNTAPTLPSQTNRTIFELTSLTVTNTATDPESPPEVLSYSLAVGPTNAQISPNGIITWTPTEAQGPGSYPITTIVSDNASPSASATNTFTVTVLETNSAPSLTLPANQTIDELAAWSANAIGVDTDLPPNNLTFALVSGPSGLTVSAAGLIEWTPTEAQGPGVYPVTVRVFDDGSPSLAATNSFSLTVNEVNSAPSLTLPANQTINELAAYSANATATDTDSPPNTLTFELVAGPSGLTVSPAGLIQWTPSEAQGPSVNPITIRVSDNGSPSLSATNTFTLTVNEVNSAPTITLPADQTIDELAAYSANAIGSDTDSPPNNLTIELVSGPTGLTVSPAGLIQWTPSETQGPSTNHVTIRVFDDGTPSLSATNAYTLTVREVNSAPSLTLPADQTIDELAAYSANATGSDTDSPPNNLTFELVSGPTGLTVGPAGLIQWTPSETQGPSTNHVTIRVFDDGTPSLSATNAYTLTVREVNSAPSLTLPADQTIDELAGYSANATASDTDSPPNNLTIELVSGPTGLTVSPAGLIQWTPDQTQSPSTNNVAIRVRDDGTPALSTTNSFTLTVREVNVAPSLPTIADQTLTQLAMLTVTNAATNANIHSTIAGYVLLNPPIGAAIDPSGIITWTPTQDQNHSTNTITTVVTNTNPYDLVNPHLTATNSFTVVVNAAEATPPTIQSIEVSDGMVVITWGAISGRTYRLQSQDTPADTNWTDVPPDVLASGSTASVTNAVGAASKQFYRIRLMP